ncbi:MAG TPA: cytochrome c3 family protein [Nitrospirota bacterium]|nr:cytochrome c3 family protein [Nitrospirota bacterium]
MRTTLLLLFCTLLFPAYGSVYAEDGCSGCHSDPAAMHAAGFPQFVISSPDLLAQIHMPAVCTDCHAGNGSAKSKEEAHTGLLTLRAIRAKTWEATDRRSMLVDDLMEWSFLEPRGNDRSTQLAPKKRYTDGVKGNPDFRTFIYHDKNAITLAFNPEIAGKTCGKCHGEIVKSFLKSAMGGGTGAHVQSQYRTWTGSTGPQSCGLWLGVLTRPGQDAFTDENIRNFNSHATMQISEKDAFNSQRTCNQCHVGCLDCHFDARKKNPNNPGDGSHTFVKKPAPLACYGGGRSFSCHAGPLERRRGDGYIRAEFTQASPEGTSALKGRIDIHMQKHVACVDCHEPNAATGYHADLRRNVSCAKCHDRVAAAIMKGPHKNVDCAACHTALIGGYAFNFWSAVGPQGKENPVTRIQDYLTGATPPLLIRNPRGIWIPVHVVPHLSGNVRAEEVRLSKKLLFRNKPDADVARSYFSNDSYAITGLVRNLDTKDHDVLVWLNVDRVAHATGTSRTCDSCHASRTQRIPVTFSGGSYKDIENGEYTIIADERSLRVVDFRDDHGKDIQDLARLKTAWELPGDFALPKTTDYKLYEKIEKDYKNGTFNH